MNMDSIYRLGQPSRHEQAFEVDLGPRFIFLIFYGFLTISTKKTRKYDEEFQISVHRRGTRS